MGEGLNEIIFRINPTILKYVPHRHRATYLTGIELRTSQASSYVPQHQRPTYLNDSPQGLVWRLHSLRLEAPFTTFGGSIHHV